MTTKLDEMWAALAEMCNEKNAVTAIAAAAAVAAAYAAYAAAAAAAYVAAAYAAAVAAAAAYVVATYATAEFWARKAIDRIEKITIPPAAQPAPVQEPVAWMRKDGTLRFADGKVFAVGQPFYTYPLAQPPQRQCVGLTDEEQLKLAKDSEGKLKEKNIV